MRSPLSQRVQHVSVFRFEPLISVNHNTSSSQPLQYLNPGQLETLTGPECFFFLCIIHHCPSRIVSCSGQVSKTAQTGKETASQPGKEQSKHHYPTLYGRWGFRYSTRCCNLIQRRDETARPVQPSHSAQKARLATDTLSFIDYPRNPSMKNRPDQTRRTQGKDK